MTKQGRGMTPDERREYMKRYMKDRRAQQTETRPYRPRLDQRNWQSEAEYDPKRDGDPIYAGPTDEFFGDPPIGRRAIDKKGK